jgi:hypothetical protein
MINNIKNYKIILLLVILIAIYFFIYNNLQESFTEVRNRTLIIYCYYEDDESKKNFEFFVKNGIIDNPFYYYIIIVNNKKNTVNIPEYNNIRVITRDENNYDLITYKLCIDQLLNENINYFDSFSNFYFINCSCIGPFVPTIINKKYDDYISLLNKKMENYDLIGPIIEIPRDNYGFHFLGIDNHKNIPFLHTYMFGVSFNGFIKLNELFKTLTNDKIEIIKAERKITSYFLINNMKIVNLLAKFNNVNLNGNLQVSGALNVGGVVRVDNHFSAIIKSFLIAKNEPK